VTPLHGSARRLGGATSQTATRFLIALDCLGVEVDSGCSVPDATKCIQSLTALVKIDFWLRNPDYLADELLNEIEAGRQSPDEVLPLAASMIGGSMPSLHRYPMVRYRYGAYERPDNALALLKAMGCVDHRRVRETGQYSRRDYYLLQTGAEILSRMRAAAPPIAWYEKQAAAIALIPDVGVGGRARLRQYEQQEYRNTAIGDLIPAITTRVQNRTLDLAGKHGLDIREFGLKQEISK